MGLDARRMVVLAALFSGCSSTSPGDHLRFGGDTRAFLLADGRAKITAYVYMEEGEWKKGDKFCVSAVWYEKAEWDAFAAKATHTHWDTPEPARAYQAEECSTAAIAEGESAVIEVVTATPLPADTNDRYAFILWVTTDVVGGSSYWMQMPALTPET